MECGLGCSPYCQADALTRGKCTRSAWLIMCIQVSPWFHQFGSTWLSSKRHTRLRSSSVPGKMLCQLPSPSFLAPALTASVSCPSLCCACCVYVPQGPEKLVEFGCTATLAVVQGNRLCLANVGDSQAVLGSMDDEGEISAEVITQRHYGKHEGEAARIRQQHAHHTRILDDGYIKVGAALQQR